MGSPSRTRLQSCRYFSCWGPSLPWLLQPQRLRLQQMLIPGMATATVATDTVDTTGLTATMATMERGLLMPSQSPPLPLTLTLMLMHGTVTTDTVTTDTAATTGLMAITVAGTGRRRGPLMPSLLLMLWPTPLLMLMPGTATMATATTATDTDMATTVLTDTDTDGTERGQQMLSQSPLLLLSPRLMLMLGTATMDTVATDTAATTGLMATMATMERGPLMPSLQLML